MSRGVNKVILIGNLGADPDTRFFPDGGAITNVTLATTESWKDRQTGQKQDRTEWHRLVFRDRGEYKLGQIAADFLRKGSKIYIEGSLRTRQWEQDGIKRYTTEIIVSEMQMLESRNASSEAESAAQRGTAEPGKRSSQSASSVSSAAALSAGIDNFNDDIPF